MAIVLDNEKYLTVREACDLAKITSQTLRVRAKALGIKKYHQQLVAPNVVYYKEEDILNMLKMQPVEEDENGKENDGHE